MTSFIRRCSLGGLLLVLTAAASAADPAPREELQLDTTSITGSRELPTVLNIVPWKRPAASDLRGRPADSLMDEVLQPVDRVETRRELRYQGDDGKAP
jgi:hypothetical protein